MGPKKVHGKFYGIDIPIDVKFIRGTGIPDNIGGIEHSHDFTELVIIYGGYGIHKTNGKEYKVQSGNAFVIHGNHTHAILERQDLKYIEVIYREEELNLPINYISNIPGYNALFVLEPQERDKSDYDEYIKLDEPQLIEATRIARNINEEVKQKAIGYESILLAKLIDLIILLSREYSKINTGQAYSIVKISKAISLLNSSYDKQWTLEDLCKISHMSKSKLMSSFKDATGHTPIQYLIKRRIEKAKQLLEKTDLAITDIAYNIGFSDSNYFSRQFHKLVGKSPIQYRSQNQR